MGRLRIYNNRKANRREHRIMKQLNKIKHKINNKSKIQKALNNNNN
jgi:hypothetical protein